MEVHGVPLSINENPKEIIQKVSKRMNVQLACCDISTAHRLFNYTDRTFSPSKVKNQHPEKSHPPPIIVRFANRDKRNEIYSKGKLLKSNPSSSSNFDTANVTIQGNLTSQRRSLRYTAKQAKAQLNFKFIWTSQGRIRIRKDTDSEIYTISSLSDLAKLGYSYPIY